MSNARELAELGGAYSTGGYPHFKNRIINGAMMIAQRGTSSIASNAGGYPVDRFFFNSDANRFTGQQSSTAPAGFTNSLVFTVTSAGTTSYAQLYQSIEGYNVADMGFGAAGASTFTLSFWVRASVTGTYSAGLMNSAADRSYVFNYTINAANTWEQKTVTVAGDTTGTWLKDNGTGLNIRFDLGSGATYTTSTVNAWQAGLYWKSSGSVSFAANAGATFYITGVQLEKGSTATAYDYRPYGTELALCQRYYSYVGSPFASGETGVGTGIVLSGTSALGLVKYPTTMRTAPTVNVSGTLYCRHSGGSTSFTSLTGTYANIDAVEINFTISSGTLGSSALLRNETSAGALTMSAEL